MKGAHVQIRCSEWTLYTQYCHWFTALSIIRWSKRRHSSIPVASSGDPRRGFGNGGIDTLLQNCRRTFEVHVHRIETRIVWRPQRWIDEVWCVCWPCNRLASTVRQQESRIGNWMSFDGVSTKIKSRTWLDGILIELCTPDGKKSGFMCVKFYLISCKFAVVTAKCLRCLTLFVDTV